MARYHSQVKAAEMTDSIQKAYWDLLETTVWICTRKPECVAAMWDMEEHDKIAHAMFRLKPEFFRIGAPESQDRPIMMPGLAQDDLLRKVHGGVVRMTASREGGNTEQVPVAPAELNGLTFFIRADYGPP